MFLFSCLNAQLFKHFKVKSLYPGIKFIKSKSYNGYRYSGYWTLSKLNVHGCIVEVERYKKRELLSRVRFVYNSNNDILFDINTFDINDANASRKDTVVANTYRYSGDMIIWQKSDYGDGSYQEIKLDSRQGDSILVYQVNDYHYRVKEKDTVVHSSRYTYRYRGHQLIGLKASDFPFENESVTQYQYDEYGRLYHRQFFESPSKSNMKSVYLGGSPFSDDMYYDYKLDKQGYVKKLYHIIDGKKYIITINRYYRH